MARVASRNVETVERVVAGWLRGDPSTIELIAEDVVYVSPQTMTGGGTYHGHEGVLRWVVEWRQEWTDYELSLERITDFGDKVLTVEHNTATGKRSGVRLERRTFSVWTLRDGKVVRWEGFTTQAEAEAAAAQRSPAA